MSGKRVAAAALFFNERGELLLVDPNYQELWHVPGGIAEAGESPREACEREIDEELGLKRHIGRLLCVDWVPENEKHPERVLFFFDGGVLNDTSIAAIRLQESELDDFAFVPTTRAAQMLPDLLARRLAVCLEMRKTGGVAYLEDGYQVTQAPASDDAGGVEA